MADTVPHPHEEATEKLWPLVEFISKLSHVEVCQIAGSLRREEPVVNVVNLVVNGPLTPEDLTGWDLGVAGQHKLRVDIESLQVDIVVTGTLHFGGALLHATGPDLFNVKLRNYAKTKGFLLNHRGLWVDAKGGGLVASKTEEDIFEALGLPYTEPGDRATLKNLTNGVRWSTKIGSKSRPHKTPYTVNLMEDDTWLCECEAATFGNTCSHVRRARTEYEMEPRP